MKRKLPNSNILQRRVRPRRDDDYSDVSVMDITEESGSQAHVEDMTSFGDENTNSIKEGDEDDQSSSSSSSEEAFTEQLGSISFGALARAQESLQSHRPSNTTTQTSNSSSKLADLRRKLQEIKNGKTSTRDDGEKKSGSKPSDNKSEEQQQHKSHSPPSGGGGGGGGGRSNKHAPAEQSSKKAVPRKREVVVVPKRMARDPRFESLSGPLNEERVRKNYSFLNGYREEEMKELRERIKKCKDEDMKTILKRELSSMESRKKAQETKDKQRELLQNHRAKERELVKQGKKPYYLKKAEQKHLLLVDRFSSLKGKQVDRVIERKRKKNAAKERRDMPRSRRGGVV